MQSALLNQTQKNKVTIILKEFEEHLRQALQWLDGYTEEGILYHRKLDIPFENQKEARKNIEEALQLISDLEKRFALEPEIVNSAAIIWGAMSIDWSQLSDIHAQDLRRAGEVHPDLADAIDGPVDHLANLALKIHANFSGHNRR